MKVYKARLFKMVSVGVVDDPVNQGYDIISTGALLVNLTAVVLMTFDKMAPYYGLLSKLEAVTVAFFAIDFILRVITAECLYPRESNGRAVFKYLTSLTGVIDILSFLPYYLPIFFPSGAVAFRMIRVARILRLFRINAYYDSLNVIGEVILRKKQQLLSSVYIILILMLASSLAMYGLEHDAQPDVFENAFSGVWWAASTLLTVGYGDIYPVTVAGKILGIIITFLGVGMVAIPTGIISAGFVEQYTRLKRLGNLDAEQDIHFVELRINETDDWVGKKVKDLGLPQGAIIAVILRGKETLMPKGDVVLKAGDTLVLGAEAHRTDKLINLKEIIVGKDHMWADTAIKDLDFSRQSLIVMIKRDGKMWIPKGNLILKDGDIVYMYSKQRKEEVFE